MNPVGLSLDPALCRERQGRLARVLAERRVDLALLVRPEHVQYFTGFRPAAFHQAVVAVFADGRTVLSAPNHTPESCAADDVFCFEAQWRCTLRQDQSAAALTAIAPSLTSGLTGKRIGVEASVNPAHFAPWVAGIEQNVIDLEPDLWRLRRRKDPDELAMIARAIECTEAMYRRAREIIVPGISELDVYNELHAAAVDAAGEPLVAVGNDFQCNSPGGAHHARDEPMPESSSFSTSASPTEGTTPTIAARSLSIVRRRSGNRRRGRRSWTRSVSWNSRFAREFRPERCITRSGRCWTT